MKFQNIQTLRLYSNSKQYVHSFKIQTRSLVRFDLTDYVYLSSESLENIIKYNQQLTKLRCYVVNCKRLNLASKSKLQHLDISSLPEESVRCSALLAGVQY